METGDRATRANTQVDTIRLYEREILLAEHIGDVARGIPSTGTGTLQSSDYLCEPEAINAA